MRGGGDTGVGPGGGGEARRQGGAGYWSKIGGEGGVEASLEFLHGERLPPEISDWEADGADHLTLEHKKNKKKWVFAVACI